MKLLRYGDCGAERPAILDANGRIRDLSCIVDDITPKVLADAVLADIAACDVEGLPLVEGAPRIGVPIQGIGKFLGIGLNYQDHAIDAKGHRAAEPVIFSKAISCLNGPNDDIVLPRGAEKPDWEVELGVVIGRVAHNVEIDDALAHVAGYVLVNDVSDRGFQNASGQWDKGKGCDTFGPIGPWLVTKGEIPAPQRLDLWLELNGRPMQRGNTANMIFSVAELVANVSRYITLMPGDVLATGTPHGVGADQHPPRFLVPGDRLRLGGTELGIQEQNVVAGTSSSF